MAEQKIILHNIGTIEIFDYEPMPDEKQLITNAEIQAEKDIIDKINQIS